MATKGLHKELCLVAILFVGLSDASVSRVQRAVDNCPTPNPPKNGEVDCVAGDALGLDIYCTFTCKRGHKFQGVRDRDLLFICDVATGFYEPPITPDCVPVCDPPCLNGGSCTGPNNCTCKPPFYGDQCIYSHQLCVEPKPPRFGSMQCTPDGNGGKTCVPVCLPTFKLETQGAAKYVCGQDGKWSPDVASIPDCVQEMNHVTTTKPVATTPVTRVNRQAMCAAWGKDHYRSFDSKIYTFQGDCRYVLAYAPNAFEIMVVNDPQCSRGGSCNREVEIFQGGSKIRLQLGANGPELSWDNKVLSVPGSRDGTVFQKVGNYMTMSSSLGYNLKWDGRQSVFIQVSDDLKGKLGGLCGTYNGDRNDDFTSQTGQLATSVADFGNSWKKTDLGQACQDVVQLGGCSVNIARTPVAQSKCQDLSTHPDFIPCHHAVSPNEYVETCKTDCCNSNSDDCMCSSMEAYSRACSAKGIKLNWRKAGRCGISCTGGKVYKECGSPCVKDCSSANAVCSDATCVDGCFCPDGQVLQNGNCVQVDQCPCEHNSRTYNPGQTIPRQCNTCTCKSGSWDCTRKTCDATCSATGDPHYQTFDGKRYNFMGTCSYYLMKDRDFSIITDNIQCGHGEASCTRGISVDINGLNIKLDHNHQVFINGREITTLPYEAPGIKISMVSSLFMQAKLSNGVTILWDGRTRAYIKAPTSFMGKTIGMCGTFDGNQQNDFTTLQGNVETIPNAFGNHWKTEQSCRNMPLTTKPDPCEVNSQRKTQAIDICSKMKSDIFKDCHNVEDVVPHYDDCVYDLCACTENMKDCMCPNIGGYADACAAQGVKINWRLQIPECMLQCPPGQEYQVCGKPCEHTCQDIATNEDELCDAKCVEGCNCPDGQTLNADGVCVSITQCPCIFQGRDYPPGYTTLQGSEICVCTDGKFKCSKITFTDGASIKKVQPLCDDNAVYTECISNCPLTCENQNNPPVCSNANCQKGCECLPGFVLDDGKCVNASMCPCHHAGKSYFEGEKYIQDCNECTCIGRKWQCDQKPCPSTCSSYGDSHYTTFDGRHYEFQGACDYVLVQSTASSPYNFMITAKNTQCGTSGVTCFKQMEIVVGKEGTPDFFRLPLIKGQSVKPEPGSPFTVKEIGDMVYITTPWGLSLQWDKGTRVYVRLTTDHLGLVEGLCGNFNHNQNDDFTPRQGGFPVVKATTFGDSWRVQSSCAPSQEITDTCQSNPQRKSWADLKCSIISSALFAPCHSFVDYKQYKDRCVFDACGCDLGGDCECLCTAVAAYAHECAINGINILWRSNDLCPIQCEDCETYNPCISNCPKKTCENRLVYDQIAKDCDDAQGVCFEGCDLHPCANGQVYDSLVEPVSCIPEALCETPACDINGKKYREGERVEDPTVCRESCEICICRKGVLRHITVGQCPPIPTS